MIQEFGAPRVPRSEIRQQDMDLAASVQLVLEENYFALLMLETLFVTGTAGGAVSF